MKIVFTLSHFFNQSVPSIIKTWRAKNDNKKKNSEIHPHNYVNNFYLLTPPNT